jgi:hypothetical protein
MTRAVGEGWQTRINDTLRSSFHWPVGSRRARINKAPAYGRSGSPQEIMSSAFILALTCNITSAGTIAFFFA